MQRKKQNICIQVGGYVVFTSRKFAGAGSSKIIKKEKREIRRKSIKRKAIISAFISLVEILHNRENENAREKKLVGQFLKNPLNGSVSRLVASLQVVAPAIVVVMRGRIPRTAAGHVANGCIGPLGTTIVIVVIKGECP